jgi:murein DD-endopeptidase MepM/ murein hydrolase activator NlpD
MSFFGTANRTKFQAVLNLTVFIGMTGLAGDVLEITPKKVSYGDIVTIKVFDISAKEIKVNKMKFPLFISKKESYSAVNIGIASWWKNGVYEVTIDERDVKDTFVIVESKRPEEKITVEPGKAAANKETKQQREFISSRISLVSGINMRNGLFILPIDSRITGEYGVRRIVNGVPYGYHRGIDLAAKHGDPIKAANSGIVTLTGTFILSGKTVIIDHGQGISSAYFHLSDISVKEKEAVGKGYIIGKAGSTGMSTGPHLHFGVYLFGADVDPKLVINNILE